MYLWHARLSFVLSCDNVYGARSRVYHINNDSTGPTFQFTWFGRIQNIRSFYCFWRSDTFIEEELTLDSMEIEQF